MPKLTFTVDSALLSELGEKLVESPHIALVELVKNAYDADATLVTVRIIPNQDGKTEVHVIDDGTGMNFDDVERYWMRIATTHKVKHNVSERYGRPRTGKKGIGRFACRRLGTNLKLITTSALNGSFEQTEVLFDWLDFIPGKEITTVSCPGTKQKLKSAEVGTILTITGGSEKEWGKRGYDFLKRQLAVLTANRGAKRKGYKEDPGFNVRLEAPGFSEDIENLREKLISAGWGDIDVKINTEGRVTCILHAMRVGKREIIHPELFPSLASVSAKIGIMPLESDEIRRKDIVSKGNLSKILEDWGGVFIRYKGFRVYPYGDPSNDWLRIDRDRGLRRGTVSPVLNSFAAKLRGVNPTRALLSLLSSRAYVGDVEIGEKAAKYFEPKASREGFIKQDGIDQLTEVIRFAIDWSTIYREYARFIEVKAEAEQAREDLEDILEQPIEPRKLITSAIRALESDVRYMATQLPTAERQKILRSIKTATTAIYTHESSNIEELRHLQLVASTSTLLLIFSHEVKSLLSWFEQVRISLDSVKRKIKEPEAGKLGDVIKDFGETKNRFLELLEMTSLISVTRKSEPARLTLLPRVEKALRSFSLIRDKYNIEIDIAEVSRSLQVGPILEAELFAVLLNLLSNSIKSVIASGGKRKIAIFAERQNKKVVINICDTGVGIKEEHFEDVFLPFSTDPEEKLYGGLDSRINPEDEYIVGTGSGLGLSIAREILTHREGTICFVKPFGDWKANVQVIIP
jgi:signal transduction histidine kinase